MGVCVPQHVVCGWYTPDFDASSDPCTLQSFDERRARLGAGGTFFRSKNAGPRNNNIKIESTWLTNTLDGNFQPIGTLVGTSDPLLFNSVRLKVYNGTELVEEWFATQSQTDPGDPGGEPPVDPTWISGVPSLQSRINADTNSIIEMNIKDVQFPWPMFDENDDEIVPTFMGMFPITRMSGATGGPTNPKTHRPKIRTGPAQSIILIANSEIGQANGSMRIVNKPVYWNGACWLAFDPLAPDCADPDNPRGCDQDPSSKCPV